MGQWLNGRAGKRVESTGRGGKMGVDRLIAGEEDRGDTVIERGSGQAGQWSSGVVVNEVVVERVVDKRDSSQTG